MTTNELIEMLLKFDQDKEIRFSSYSGMLNMKIESAHEEDDYVIIEE